MGEEKGFLEKLIDGAIFASILEEEQEKERYAWREFRDEGLEYGLCAHDYETEEEYDAALEEEKYGWREYCEDGDEYGLDPED